MTKTTIKDLILYVVKHYEYKTKRKICENCGGIVTAEKKTIISLFSEDNFMSSVTEYYMNNKYRCNVCGSTKLSDV